MEKEYVVVTDSTSNLPEDLIAKYDVEILSLNYYVDNQEYKGYEKNVKKDLTQFYKMMRDKKEIVTSLVTIGDVMKCFERILQSGKNILYIGFSSALSGTLQAVSMVSEELKAKYTEREIYVIDSLAAALGEGLLVYYALKNRENGISLEENAKWIMQNRLKLCHWFTVDDLFFLKRGGRISSTTAIVGTALSIKPVLHVDNQGRLIPIAKVRGRKKSLDSLIEHMAETVVEPENQYVYISHGDCLEDAEYVAKKVKERFGVKDVLIRLLDPVIAAHSGPGTVALFFLGTQR